MVNQHKKKKNKKSAYNNQKEQQEAELSVLCLKSETKEVQPKPQWKEGRFEQPYSEEMAKQASHFFKNLNQRMEKEFGVQPFRTDLSLFTQSTPVKEAETHQPTKAVNVEQEYGVIKEPCHVEKSDALAESKGLPSTLSWISGFLLLFLVVWTVSYQKEERSDQKTKPIYLQAKGAAQNTFELLHAPKTQKGFIEKRVISDGMKLAPGDAIQFRYFLAQDHYIMILSLSEKGKVSPYYPLEQKDSLHVKKGKGFLPSHHSLVLDHSKGKELILVLASKRPFTFDAIQKRIKESFREADHRLKTFHWSSKKTKLLFKRWFIK